MLSVLLTIVCLIVYCNSCFNEMLKQPAGNIHMINWRREVCDAVRVHLVSHDDERLRPVQRDENHHVCDVSHEQHEDVYLERMCHTDVVIVFSVVHWKW